MQVWGPSSFLNNFARVALGSEILSCHAHVRAATSRDSIVARRVGSGTLEGFALGRSWWGRGVLGPFSRARPATPAPAGRAFSAAPPHCRRRDPSRCLDRGGSASQTSGWVVRGWLMSQDLQSLFFSSFPSPSSSPFACCHDHPFRPARRASRPGWDRRGRLGHDPDRRGCPALPMERESPLDRSSPLCGCLPTLAAYPPTRLGQPPIARASGTRSRPSAPGSARTAISTRRFRSRWST